LCTVRHSAGGGRRQLPWGAPVTADANTVIPTFSVVDTQAGLAALEPEWDALCARCPDASVFQSFRWQFRWWETYGAGRRLRLVLMRDGDRLLGIAPCYVESVSKLPGLRLETLRFVGLGGDTMPDDLGFLLEPAAKPLAAALAAYVLDEVAAGVDVFEFGSIGSAAPELAALEAAARARGLRVEAEVESEISYIDLPGTVAAYLDSLSANRRWKVRRARSRLGQELAYTFGRVESTEDLPRRIDDLVALHRSRWEGRAAEYGFRTPTYLAFHRAVMHDLLARDALRLFYIEVASRPIAMNYCYRWRDGYYFFQAGLDPAFEKYRVGEVLMVHAIETAIAEGCKVFDMLRGDHAYKKSLARQQRRTMALAFFRRGPCVRLYEAVRAVNRWLRRRILKPTDH
jgi:CelD/BcsL family acetyltransferase involved in cellulose biosynthesis